MFNYKSHSKHGEPASLPGCNCDGLDADTVDDWYIDIQKDSTQNPYDVVQHELWVQVGGGKRVFVRRHDREPFCLSAITMNVLCVQQVYLKINFVDGTSVQVDAVDVTSPEDSEVVLGPFDPIYTDVASVRVGFAIASPDCTESHVRYMRFSTCPEA